MPDPDIAATAGAEPVHAEAARPEPAADPEPFDPAVSSGIEPEPQAPAATDPINLPEPVERQHAADPEQEPGEPRPLPAIRARGRSFMALVLSPEPPLLEWITALDAQIAKSGDFFATRPVVLDCGLLTPEEDGLHALVPALAERGIRLIEIENADRDWEAAADWQWPDAFGGGRAVGAVEIPEEAPPPPPDPARASLLIEEPVRSGRIVSYQDGDVIVLGSVASGAEISAGGSIHVYGSLRGRALAGVGGNTAARILCRRLHAELLAIDGFYMTAEDMDPAWLGQSTQARLDGESLVLSALD